MIGRFLGGIAALIWDPETDRYILLRRVDQRDFGAGAWECVTGRVNQGESYEKALHREVGEEIGARVQIEFLIALTHFFRGAPTPENELLGAIFGCTLHHPAEIHISEEHSKMIWVSAEQAYQLLGDQHWLTHVIQKAELLRAQLPMVLRDEFRQKGFEI